MRCCTITEISQETSQEIFQSHCKTNSNPIWLIHISKSNIIPLLQHCFDNFTFKLSISIISISCTMHSREKGKKERFIYLICSFPDFVIWFLFTYFLLGNTDEKCSTLSRQHSRGSHKPKLITLPVDSAPLHQRK